MQQILSIVAAATTLATTAAGTTAIVASSPIAVSTCAVSDLYNPASMPEFVPQVPYRLLQLTFRNTDEAVATQVAFDVVHAGVHTMVIDRGRFSQGVTIEHQFDDAFADGRGPEVCTVAAITFADGRRWSAPGYGKTASTALR
jgi:hypothetical protein